DASFEPTAVERAVAMASSGGFVTAGRSVDEFPRRFLARRLTRDGKVDARFGGGSVVIPDVDRGEGEIRVAGRRGTGGLVMVGVTGDDAPGVFVAKFQDGGHLDPSFGGHGYVTLDLGPATIVGIAELADDGVMLCGAVRTDTQSFRGLIVRLRQDGSLDDSFGDKGRLMLDRGDSLFSSLVVMDDGEVIAGGYLGYQGLLAKFPSR